MKIGILGAGNVGGTLGTQWAKRGHSVKFGVRNVNAGDVQQLLRAAPGSSAGPLADAVAFGEAVLVALPYDAVKSVVSAIPAANWSGKVVIDATNPLLPNLAGLAVGHTTSVAEQLATWIPSARVVKAFNTIGMGNVADLDFAGQKATGFYCGDDSAAKAVVKQLAAEVGFDPLDCGPLSQARLLEPLAMLWISLAYKHGHGTNIAFRLLKR